MTKVFDGLGVAEDLKVGLATYLFDGEADHWWESVERMRDIIALTWGEFDQIFQDKYFSESVRDGIKADFLALRQGSTTMVEYERRFTELSRYAMEFISTEANRAKRFEQGLKLAIREKLVALKIRDYGDMVDRAALLKRDIEDSQRLQSWARGGPIQTGAGSSGVQRATPYRRPDQTVGPRPQLARGARGVPVGAGIDSRSALNVEVQVILECSVQFIHPRGILRQQDRYRQLGHPHLGHYRSSGHWGPEPRQCYPRESVCFDSARGRCVQCSYGRYHSSL